MMNSIWLRFILKIKFTPAMIRNAQFYEIRVAYRVIRIVM